MSSRAGRLAALAVAGGLAMPLLAGAALGVRADCGYR